MNISFNLENEPIQMHHSFYCSKRAAYICNAKSLFECGNKIYRNKYKMYCKKIFDNMSKRIL